jgi:type 2 lantibiotic biosynthesis protein LanM
MLPVNTNLEINTSREVSKNPAVQENPKLVLFADRLFPTSLSESKLDNPETAALVVPAIRQLKAEAPDPDALLSPQLEKALPAALSRFLAPLILLRLEHNQLYSATRNWIDAQLHLLRRLHCDLLEIERRFSPGSACRTLTALELDLSDPHDYGRSVALLTFQSGLKLVYKPRDIRVEAWYFQALAALNDIGAPLPFYTLKTLARANYGWMEFVPYSPCHSQDELNNYYINAGALLCALHLFGATDCHFQNVIAFREHPVLVDAETLFQPQISEAESQLLTRSGLLPQWRFGPQEQAYDVSALGFVVPQTSHFLIPKWTDAGVHFELGMLIPRHNVPFCATSNPPKPYSYVTQMETGFKSAYRFIANNRDEVFALIGTASNLPIRYIFRDTIEYYEAAYKRMCSGNSHSTCLQELPQARSVFRELRDLEEEALIRHDIPRFTLSADSSDFCGIVNCLPVSGISRARKILAQLCDTDLDRQLSALRAAWAFSRIHNALL